MMDHGVNRGDNEYLGSLTENFSETGHRFKPGHLTPSMTCREGLTTLPWHGQFVDL